MLDHPGGTVRALEAMAAMAAQGQGGIAAPVEEEQALLARFEIGFQLAHQARRQPAAALRWVFEQIDGANIR